MEVDLHVTNRCSLRCQHCVYKSGELAMDDVTLETVQRLSQDFKKLEVDEVHLTGGEPLLHRAIFDIIEYLKQNGFKVRMQTNGMLVNETTAQKLKNLRIDSILISLDGLKSSHNKMRGNDESFDLAIAAARTCLSKGIFTRINTVLHKDNLSEISDLLQLTTKLQVHQHSFFYLTPIGRGKNLWHNILSLEDWKSARLHILSCAQKFGCIDKVKIQDVFRENPSHNERSNLCRNDNCLIMANGDVFSCVFFVHSNYKLGNIHERALCDIWQDPLAWQKVSFSRKKSCNDPRCNGGCPGLSYLLTGTPTACDPRCSPKNGLFSGCIRQYDKE